jgi:hypothetical protein
VLAAAAAQEFLKAQTQDRAVVVQSNCTLSHMQYWVDVINYILTKDEKA